MNVYSQLTCSIVLLCQVFLLATTISMLFLHLILIFLSGVGDPFPAHHVSDAGRYQPPRVVSRPRGRGARALLQTNTSGHESLQEQKL